MTNKKKEIIIQDEIVMSKIYKIRGQKVMIDNDLAQLYETETKVLKQAVKRNIDIFPKHFMFELSQNEYESLRSQIVTSNKGRGETRYLPMVFTELGILQLANVLKSQPTRNMSIRIIEVFIKMREMLLTHKDLLLEMEEIRKKVTGQDKKIQIIFDYLKQFISDNEKPRKEVSFKVKRE